MEEEAAGTRLDVQRRLSDGCHALLSRYRLQRHLVIGPHRPTAIASLHRRSMAASRGLLISPKKRSSRQLLLDGRLLGNNPAEQLSELGYVNSLKTVPGFSETTASCVQMARRLQFVDPAFEPNVVVTLQDVHCRRKRDPEKRAISLEVSRVIARSERISPTTEENLNP
jgi:hypothetical protein